jgi:hypothetical protein
MGSVALAVWVGAFAVALVHAERHLPRDIQIWRQRIEIGGDNVRGYLAGDRSRLSGVPIDSIPYPDSDRLRVYLDAPEARASLPPALLGKAAPRNRIEAFKGVVLGFAPGWAGLGVAGLLIAAWPWAQRDFRGISGATEVKPANRRPAVRERDPMAVEFVRRAR